MIDAGTADPIALARQAYAEELRFTAHVHRPEVAAAFAAVPRERFVGPGPWRVRSPVGGGGIGPRKMPIRAMSTTMS